MESSYQQPNKEYVVYNDPNENTSSSNEDDSSDVLVAIAIFLVGFIFFPVWVIGFCFFRSRSLVARCLALISIALFFIAPVCATITAIILYRHDHHHHHHNV